MKDEKDKTEGSARLTYTGLRGGLEHLKIEKRLIGRVCHPQTVEVSGIFTTTGRILFYNNWPPTSFPCFICRE
jgi:hypothetical protein